MKSSTVILAIFMAVASADVSHLTSHYLSPSYYLQNQQHHHRPVDIQMPLRYNQRPSNERVETTIEKHEVVELPTQTEIIKEGQHIYGVHSQSIEMTRVSTNKNNRHVPEIKSRYLVPAQEIENLQPPYEMPMRTYLPPVAPDTTTTDVPPTTTTISPPTTTYNLSTKEHTTTEKQFTTEQDTTNYPITTTAIPAQEQKSYDTNTSPPKYVTISENRYLPPMPMTPQNQYMPPLAMILPPPEPTHQLTYQQYQEQLVREQHMQQMYRKQEMQEVMHAIAEMEQQQMISLEPQWQRQQQQQQQQQQPAASVEPAHVLREDGYHYKTDKDDLRHYRYRH